MPNFSDSFFSLEVPDITPIIARQVFYSRDSKRNYRLDHNDISII